ncbi:MAG: hypothetical protein ABIE03_01480 [Patescibacteria group bacterium]
MDNKQNDPLKLVELADLILGVVGLNLTEREKGLLLSREKDIEKTDELKKDIGTLYDNLIKGYFLLGVKGHKFTDINRIREFFGRSLEDNYPEASETFLKFATTYWTFKLYLQDFRNLSEYYAFLILSRLEFDTASIFFPTPGLHFISSIEREKTQRELLKVLAPEINIEDFIKGNPILIRDKQMEI